MADGGTSNVDITVQAASTVTDALGGDEPNPTEHLLNILSDQYRVAQGEQELLSLNEIKDQIKLLDHQLEAAHRALFSMGGSAIFADEVGLGKTIEIGMVLKEMDFRATHDTFLILTPAQLVPQWRTELEEKFGLEFVSNYDDEFQGFDAHDRIIASVDTAKTSNNFDDVVARNWDVLVVDEAHKLRNESTKRYELLSELTYGNAYFATATPVQNDITDVYNIVNLVHPGLFGTRNEFAARYLPDVDGAGIKNAEQLQQKLNQVMIRNQREETDIDFTNRRVRTNAFEPTTAERELYEAVTEYVRSHYSNRGAKHLVLLMLEKEVVSSPAAVLSTVENWLDDVDRSFEPGERAKLSTLKEIAGKVDTTSKGDRLRTVLQQLSEEMQVPRAVVFTQFRATQDTIVEQVRDLDLPVHTINGDASSVQKSKIVNEFEEQGGVMVATDSISEGRNMQFCNVLVNYDLPWNPMKVEQRIGRVDRIGQDREVHVFNLALEGTVEEQVLTKLYNKINLFNQSIGGLREILSQKEQSGSEFEQEVFERLRTADNRVELENKFEDMAVDLEQDQEAADKMNDFNKRVFDGFEFGGDMS